MLWKMASLYMQVYISGFQDNGIISPYQIIDMAQLELAFYSKLEKNNIFPNIFTLFPFFLIYFCNMTLSLLNKQNGKSGARFYTFEEMG